MSRNLKKSLICLSLIGGLLFLPLKPAYASNFNISYIKNLSGQSTIIAFDNFDINIEELIQGFFNFLENVFNPENFESDPNSEINLPEVTAENFLDSDSETLRFGDESAEIQANKSLLNHAESQVDADRRLLNTEQVKVDDAQFRINRLSDQISHETNENLVREYQSEKSLAEMELTEHQQKLEQARANLASHQQEEFRLEDKLREAQNKDN